MIIRPTVQRGACRRQRGFTLVELMVTVAIALFLLGGLATVVQNMRGTYLNQQNLVQLQDEQRFALTVITDAIQAAGYAPDPTTQSIGTLPIGGAFTGGGWLFAGTHAGATDSTALDSISTRFYSSPNSYGPVLCNGIDTKQLAAHLYTVAFSVNASSQLVCSVDGGAATPLVDNVVAFAVYYGVKHNFGINDYNVDTYENWNVLAASGADALNVSSVRIIITFKNPLAGQPSQPANLTIERVIQVMARGGLKT